MFRRKGIGSTQRKSLFQTICKSSGKCCKVIVYSRSTDNLVSKEMVVKLGLNMLKHPCPYEVIGLQDDQKIEIKERCLVNFNIGPFRDEVLCDVVFMSVCHVLLGKPWQYDRGAIYDYRRNLVTIEKDGQKFTLISLKEEEEVKNMSPKRSCNTKKPVAKVIPQGLKKDPIEPLIEVILEGDMRLWKDLTVEPNGQMEPVDREIMVKNRIKSCGRTKSALQKQKQCEDLKQGKSDKGSHRLETLVEAPEELRQRLANKEDVWIRNENGIFILNPFRCS